MWLVFKVSPDFPMTANTSTSLQSSVITGLQFYLTELLQTPFFMFPFLSVLILQYYVKYTLILHKAFKDILLLGMESPNFYISVLSSFYLSKKSHHISLFSSYTVNKGTQKGQMPIFLIQKNHLGNRTPILGL